MEQFLLYLLKSAAVLSLFLLVYQLLLRNDTRFQGNRHFLLSGMLTAAVLPALEFTRIIEVALPMSSPAFAASGAGVPFPEPAFEINWWNVAGGVYAIVAGILLLRILIQLFSLLRIIRGGRMTKQDGFSLIYTSKELAPFSFFHYIVLNPRLHSQEDLQNILEHEKNHASQWHSVDVLLSNFATSLVWFNPLSWWYRKVLVQNLEYIADRKTVAAVPRDKYQHTLVKLAVSDHQPLLANNFYQSLIKKRIVMLNKKPTSSRSLWKFGSILPLLLAFMLFFNVRTEAQITSQVTEISATVTKESTEKDLKNLVSFFRKNDIELKFEDVKRNAKGDITNISALARNEKNTKEKGSFKLNDTEGIKSFQVSVRDGKIAFNDLTELQTTSSTGLLRAAGKKPLFIINKKEFTSDELKGKVVSIEGQATVLTGEDAKTYGARAKDGVIIIGGGEIKEYANAFKGLDSSGQSSQEFIWVSGDAKPMYVSVDKTIRVTSNNIIPHPDSLNASQQNFKVVSYSTQNPKIVVNGQAMQNDFVLSSINANDISTVNVFKDSLGGTIKVVTKEYAKKYKNDKVVYSADTIVVNKIRGYGSTTDIKGVSTFQFSELDAALYVVNGKVKAKDFDPKSIKAEDIESVTILKGKAATDKYGKKAENGVVEVTTKK